MKTISSSVVGGGNVMLSVVTPAWKIEKSPDVSIIMRSRFPAFGRTFALSPIE